LSFQELVAHLQQLEQQLVFFFCGDTDPRSSIGVARHVRQKKLPKGETQQRVDQERHQDERENRPAIAQRFAEFLER
jgi:hypothetical protein